MITQFTILGERCSGTNFVQYALCENFNIKYVPHFPKNILEPKHFFGHGETYTDSFIESTIFIFVVRDLVEWIDSFYKRLHHVPPKNRVSAEAFITNEWYSIWEEGPNTGKEILEDRNMFTKERYKNIFEMKDTKMDYCLHTLKPRVKYFMVLRYEDLRDDYIGTLTKIEEEFQLTRQPIAKTEFKQIAKYKGSYNAYYYKKPILLSEQIRGIISSMNQLSMHERASDMKGD